jgi:hypothetical protein
MMTVLLVQELLIVLELIDAEEAKEILGIMILNAKAEVVQPHLLKIVSVMLMIQMEGKVIQHTAIVQIIPVVQEEAANLLHIMIVAQEIL